MTSYLSPKSVKMPEYADVIHERSFRSERGRELTFQLGTKVKKFSLQTTNVVENMPQVK